MKKLYSLVLATFLSVSMSYGQAVWDLGSGDFSFTTWSPDAAAGTYPAGLKFKQYTLASADPTSTDDPSTDWKCFYNLTARSRIVGRGDSGIAFINTQTNQNDLQCDSVDANTIVGGKAGAAVVTLSSTGRESLTISFVAGTDLQSDGTPTPRVYDLVLQARPDSVSAWTDFSAGTYSTAGASPNSVQSFSGIVLPFEYNNQSIVQVRWKAYQSNAGVGSRPRLTLDDIAISSSIFTGINPVSGKASFEVYPNPSSQEINFTKPVSGQILDATGRVVMNLNASTKVDVSAFQTGLYFLRSTAGEIVKVSIK
jgi:hypothetical protein